MSLMIYDESFFLAFFIQALFRCRFFAVAFLLVVVLVYLNGCR